MGFFGNSCSRWKARETGSGPNILSFSVFRIFWLRMKVGSRLDAARHCSHYSSSFLPTSRRTLDQFTRLVEDPISAPKSVAILTGPGWRLRDKLLSRLAPLALRQRETFRDYLVAAGFELPIPGMVPRNIIGR